MDANIDFVTERIAVGGDLAGDDRHAASQIDNLVEVGITHIIDCREEWSDEEAFADRAPHVRYLHIGVDDDGGELPPSFFGQGVDFATEALAKEDSRVLAHCHMGINRGPSMGYAILLAQGWDPVEALAAIRDARPIAAIAYSEQALAAHLEREGAERATWVGERRRVRAWHDDNWIDVPRIIRRVRADEAGLDWDDELQR
jgi:dual specificity phosphatase 3